jgi:hypothetical protein
VNRKKVARMIRDDNLLAIQPKRFVVTTNSKHKCEATRCFFICTHCPRVLRNLHTIVFLEKLFQGFAMASAEDW